MTDQYLGPLVSGNEILPELRRRKSIDVYKAVTGASKKIVAQKVRLEEAGGWRTVRKNLRSTRMAKAKRPDEQLEDEVWCTLAQMGFGEMSKGRQFTMAVGGGLPRRQMDVFAKDDETIVIVECTQRETPGRKPMASLIERVTALREPLFKSIRRAYGRAAKNKVKLVIATRNVWWTDGDLAKCREAKIAVVTDSELDYYAQLVRHLKHAARYQFLGHMFGGQKIDGLARQVLATRGKMGGATFYTFLIRPDDLLKIAYVGHKASRDTENLATYQRMLQPRRLKRIAAYINDGGRFPTNIVVNFKSGRKARLRFDVMDRSGEGDLGTLYLPSKYASAWIIDGQHRLYGYAYARNMKAFKSDSTALSVLAYENLPSDKEMNLFIDINSKQVKVSAGLLVELYSDLHWCSSDPEDAFQALLSRIASRLNSEKTSPVHDRMVVTGKRKTHYRCLTQTSIRDGLKEAKLLGTVSKGAIVPGPLSTASPTSYDANLTKSISVLLDCLRMFSTELAEHWRLGDSTGGYLCTNNGIRALFHVMGDIADHIRNDSGTDLCLLSAEEAFAEIRPYLQVLVGYFGSAPAQDIQAFRRIGSSLTAVRQQAYGMEAQIVPHVADFKPRGLQEYLDSRDEAGTEEAGAKVTKIHKRLFDHVVGTLKTHHGTKDKAWWTKGIPLKIRQSCTAEWEAKNRLGEEESHLYLINYIDICHHNWSLFKDVISLDKPNKDNKRENTKWIKDLNEIRKITTHPERGVLSTLQVAFVNECVDKVEQWFPADTSHTESVG